VPDHLRRLLIALLPETVLDIIRQLTDA